MTQKREKGGAAAVQPHLAKQRSWVFEWDGGAGGGFVEKMTSRRPDALVQRYLLK
jgi:hypothetical protein